MNRKEIERDISKLDEFSHYYEKGMRRLEHTGITEEEFTFSYDAISSMELTDKEIDDEMIRDAVERCISNVSETLHHLSPETISMLESEDPHLDWIGLSKYRNYPGHDYPQVNFKMVWGIAHELSPYNDVVQSVASILRDRIVSGEYNHADDER